MSGAWSSQSRDGGALLDADVWDLLAEAGRALSEQDAQDLHRVLGEMITVPRDGLGAAQRAELREQFYAVGRALARLDPEFGKGWTEDSFMIAELALRDRHEKLLATPSLLLEHVLARLASRARHRTFVTRATRPGSALTGYRSLVFTRVIPACGPPARVPDQAGTAG